MLFTSVTQFVVLGLLLFIGWLFGFASHSGGKRWRRAYEEEAVGRAQDRDELDQQLRQADARIAELEREKAALSAQLEAAGSHRDSVVAPTAVAATEARPAYAPPEEPAQDPVVATAPEPVSAVEPVAAPEPQPEPEPEPEPVKRGWFDWGKTDDLSRIRGIDAELERKLREEKVETFREIAELTDQDEIALERRLDLPAGFIQREEWRQQARMLAEGDSIAHGEKFGDRGEPVRPLPLS